LFGQILNSCRYLGNDALIKHVFLQMLDAVEYCHNLGIYHRDLKPENVLCFDGGLRIALTDFGLATTDRFSEEFRTGSVYHMSPECQGSYSPLFNDIWSLAIILLNLATGRNPWKSASASDPTFQAYLQDPVNFLPTVLPISPEANAVLVQMLEVDWRHRMTLAEVRTAIEGIESFYSEGAAFEGSMARCPWEVGVQISSGSESSKEEPRELSQQAEPIAESQSDLKSFWSVQSDSAMDFAAPQTPATDRSLWMDYSTCAPSWNAADPTSGRSCSPSPPPEGTYADFDTPRTPPSTYSPLSARSSLPATPEPEGFDIPMEYRPVRRLNPLRLDTDCGRRRFVEGGIFSSMDSTMETAVDSAAAFDPFSSSPYYLASAVSASMPSSCDLGSPVTMDTTRAYGSMSSWGDYEEDDGDDEYSIHQSMATDRATSDDDFDVEDMVISPDTHFWMESSQAPVSPPERPPAPAFAHFADSSSSSSASASGTASPKRTSDEKLKSGGLFNSIKFAFPRSPRAMAASISSASSQSDAGGATNASTFVPLPQLHRAASPNPTTWHLRSPKPTQPIAIPPTPNTRQDARVLRSSRRWFSPGKLFAGV
ncbi:hypothetical protein FIBSPDRAFT_865405, partial [Athelia psychrophila]